MDSGIIIYFSPKNYALKRIVSVHFVTEVRGVIAQNIKNVTSNEFSALAGFKYICPPVNDFR